MKAIRNCLFLLCAGNLWAQSQRESFDRRTPYFPDLSSKCVLEIDEKLKDFNETDMIVESRLLGKDDACNSDPKNKKGFLKSERFKLSPNCGSLVICIGKYDKSIKWLKSIECNQDNSVLSYRKNLDEEGYRFDYWPNGNIKSIELPGGHASMLYLESNFGKAAPAGRDYWPNGGIGSMELPSWVREGSKERDVEKVKLEINYSGQPIILRFYGKNNVRVVPVKTQLIEKVSDFSYGNLISDMPLAKSCCKRESCKKALIPISRVNKVSIPGNATR